jgi:hypothetical protein
LFPSWFQEKEIEKKLLISAKEEKYMKDWSILALLPEPHFNESKK